MGCIYALILQDENSEENNWMYIGQTVNKNRRWVNKGNSYIACTLMQNAILKHGWDAFKLVILEDDLPNEMLNDREQYWIKYYHTYVGDPEYKGGYNLTAGGSLNCKGVHLLARGRKPKNFWDLVEQRKRKIKCINTGTYNGVSFQKDQTWNSIEDCSSYFGLSNTWVHHRLTNSWSFISGPIFVYAEDETDYDEIDFGKRKNELKERQMKAGQKLGKMHKTGSKIDYSILCEETGEVFDMVRDCLKRFDIARSTLNGHINYPDRHPTAKGYHFRRIPKIAAND